MFLQSVTQTANFDYLYLDAFLTPADKTAAIDRALALASTCEADLAVLEEYFEVGNQGFAPANRVSIVVTTIIGPTAFGSNRGYDSNVIFLVPFTGKADGDAAARAVFVAEMAEIMMDYRNQQTGTDTWVPSNSMGEALSTVCEAMIHPEGYYTATVNGGTRVRITQWLNSPTRPDWVTQVEATDKNFVSFGCGIVFIYYMHSQLGFPLGDIITRAGATLAETYANLTGAPTGWEIFIELINAHFPKGTTYHPISDDVFPLPELRTFYDPNPITAGYGGTTQVSADISGKTELVIHLSSDDPALVTVPSSVTIPIGAVSTSVPLQAGVMATPFSMKTTQVRAAYGNESLPITVEIVSPTVASLELSPTAVVCGASSTGTILLDVPSLLGDVVVELTCGAPGFATVPARVPIPQGANSATFLVTTPSILIPFASAHAEVVAMYAGTFVTATLTVESQVVAGIIDSLTLLQPVVVGGETSHGRVTLIEAVPKATVVGLTAVESGGLFPVPENASSVVSVPSLITIPAGRTTAEFPITTKALTPPTTKRTATIIAFAVDAKYEMLTITE